MGFILGDFFTNTSGQPSEKTSKVASHVTNKYMAQRLHSRSEYIPKGACIYTRVARWYMFIAKNPNLGIFWMALDWKMLVYFLYFWNTYGHLIYIKAICWYI
jgi:hypothetical protein